MPLTDLAVMRYLVEETSAAIHPIVWTETDSGSYETRVNDVRVELSESFTRTRNFPVVTLHAGPDKIHISEPAPAGLFGSKYADDDQRRLAELIRQLAKEVAAQCARRRAYAHEHADELKQEIFQQLIFGPPVSNQQIKRER